MGILDRFRRVQATELSWGSSTSTAPGAWQLTNEEYERILGLSPGDMWRTQPYLRTVVTFLARNIAQLGLHTFQRVDENDRQRVRDGVGQLLARPNQTTTTYELVYGLVADLALYDVAYWLVSTDPDNPLTRLPVQWTTPRGGDLFGPEAYDLRINDKGEATRIPADQVLAFHGWHPGSLSNGSSPVHALREVLAEQVQAAKYREAVWKRGGKVGAVLSRPASAPVWSDEARKQFKADWDSQFTGSGSRVGGTPLLEDGMELSRVDFSAKEMEFIEGSRLALNTVASVYHVNPTMIGLLDNANYSNVREFRRMLYGDTLGPTIAMIEDRINAFLVPRLDARPGLYCEFNIDEKLQGSFEEQTTALQSAVGRPWMTTNEARALRNMPAVQGGDELVTPLNVLVGGQASPTDSAPPAEPKGRELGTKRGNLFLLKARVTDRQQQQVASVLTKFLDRQGAAVLAKLGTDPEGEWWDEARWNRELAKDLHQVALHVTETLGKAEASALGFSADDYDPDRTVQFLAAVADRHASNMNLTTKGQLDAALADEDADPAQVFSPEATQARAGGVAVGVTTFLAGFATTEAAAQISYAHDDVEPRKTWVTGPNARPDHAEMDGETVGLDEAFSNGMSWPGEGGGDPADVAGCNCSVEVTLS